MSRAIRRKDREIGEDEAVMLMTSGAYGVLATVDSHMQPYAVPLSYVYRDGCIFFHCAKDGHKNDNLRSQAAVSFCVVGLTRVLPDSFSTEYESAVAFGTAQELHGQDKKDALLLILEKYSPGFMAEGKEYLEARIEHVSVFKIDVLRLSGKARR